MQSIFHKSKFKIVELFACLTHIMHRVSTRFFDLHIDRYKKQYEKHEMKFYLTQFLDLLLNSKHTTTVNSTDTLYDDYRANDAKVLDDKFR